MPLPILTQALEIAVLSPIPLPDTISAKLHSLACRHYGQRRPGYSTYSQALARLLLKTEPARYLEKCLMSSYPAAQAETLAYLGQKKVNVDHHVSLQDALLRLASSPETTLANRVVATELLAGFSEADGQDDYRCALLHLYTANKVPAIRQALLPLLAQISNTSLHLQDSSFIQREISELGEDESSASREAACNAVARLGRWLDEAPFRYAYQLLHFLQDDDIDVRMLAGRLVSKLFAQGQPLCTSRAAELTWQACLNAASLEDKVWLSDVLLSQLERTIQDLETGPQLLFAVERANMHIDVTINLEKSAECFEQLALRSDQVNNIILARIRPLEERFDKFDIANNNKPSQAESHQVRKAYAYVRASLLLRTLQQAI